MCRLCSIPAHSPANSAGSAELALLFGGAANWNLGKFGHSIISILDFLVDKTIFTMNPWLILDFIADLAVKHFIHSMKFDRFCLPKEGVPALFDPSTSPQSNKTTRLNGWSMGWNRSPADWKSSCFSKAKWRCDEKLEEIWFVFENCTFQSYIALKLALSACSDPDGHF